MRQLRPSLRRALIALVAAGVVAGAAAVAWGGSGTHYALNPLRDCLALRGGLVTLVSGGVATEGTVTLAVKGDRALVSFAADDREARALAGSIPGATRHGSLVVYGEGGPPGDRAKSTLERCLSDGEGRPDGPPTGFRYAEAAIATFEQARLPLADFQRIAVATVLAEEEQMTELLDGCRLVG